MRSVARCWHSTKASAAAGFWKAFRSKLEEGTSLRNCKTSGVESCQSFLISSCRAPRSTWTGANVLVFGKQAPRNATEQTARVSKAVDEALATHAALRSTIVDPALIVRVRTTHFVSEEEWTRAGLLVLGHDENDSVVLFSSDAELTDFRARLTAYGQTPPQVKSILPTLR